MTNNLDSTKFVYLAFPDYKNELLAELNSVIEVRDNLIFSSELKSDIFFAMDIWLNPKIVTISSIGDAAKILQAENRFWFLYPLSHFRRSKLIEDKIRNPFKKLLNFPLDKAIPKTGVFCLLDENTMLYSSERARPIPIGLVNFVEDKKNPPNRAYLKLWEAFTFLGQTPKPGDICMDLGSSPGGWTHVLHEFGAAKVYSVDKAELDISLQNKPNIEFIRESAFALDPKKFPVIDWLCADIACYPERLYALVDKWLHSGKVKNMICTIKLQGATDFSVLLKFQTISNARVQHLFFNKHEVTLFISVI